jgi:hypothetical protein
VVHGSRRRVGASFCVLACLVGAAGTAAAQAPQPLGVERDPGAEECPDDVDLAARIERIRHKPAPDTGAYRVRFSRDEERFTATISTLDRAHIRTLESHRPSCSALGDAVAVTLALLYDSELGPTAPPPPPPPPPMAAPAPHAPTESSRLGFSVGLGAAWIVGVTAPTAFAGQAEASIYRPRWRIGAGVLWIAPETHELGPGTVRERLLGGTARLCLSPIAADPVGMDFCSGVLAAAVTATASGYSRNETRSRPWVAVPIELVLRSNMQSVGIELGAGAVVPVARDDFSVDGVGVAYQSPNVAGMASVRVVALFR